jgi:hypothetical protein
MFDDTQTSDDTDKRRQKRTRVIIRAIVHTATGNQVERRVRNLSDTGACIDHSGDLAAGDQLFLDMGTRTALPARVVWARESLAGITFSEPVDLAAARQPRRAAA